MGREQGLREKAVRDSLASRPAAIINGASIGASRCFAGFFNGASGSGTIWANDALHIGKAECEWDWRQNWAELKSLGLLEWTEEDKPNHPDIGGVTRYVYPQITEKGWQVREDDMKWFRELMDAMHEDEPPSARTTG